jgi:S-adenosylmethionine:tRNA ribosyltransferase-isomerase
MECPVQTLDFDYNLPPELIASEPLQRRSDSRLMLIERASGRISHHHFSDIVGWVGSDDLLVLNNTRVVPARFYSDDGRVELLKVETTGPLSWRCMVRPGRRMRLGAKVTVAGVGGEVVAVHDNGERTLVWEAAIDEERHGLLALPPYMQREQREEDRERYQTVYARESGAIAAPTAGLHFTPEILGALPHEFITLHVGVGTFAPVKVEDVAEHRMHSERYRIGSTAAQRIAQANRVIAVGTTSVRTLESVARDHGSVLACEGSTDIFIYPGFEFRVVGALLTNFHLPKSTLIMLVSAFANRELIMEAYAKAVEQRYRFFSYGDCMLLV